MTVAIVWNTVAIRNPNEFPVKPKIVESSTCAATDPPYEFTLIDAVLGCNEKKLTRL